MAQKDLQDLVNGVGRIKDQTHRQTHNVDLLLHLPNYKSQYKKNLIFQFTKIRTLTEETGGQLILWLEISTEAQEGLDINLLAR